MGDAVRHPATRRAAPVAARTALVESMFSTVCDLASDRAELLARLHPLKKRHFDALLAAGGGAGAGAVLLQVSTLRGGVETIDYASLAATPLGNVVGEAQARGFDAGAEPVIRQLRDKSFRLLFHTMPPASHPLGKAFDVDHFCDSLLQQCAADMHKDDREVFYIAQSAGAADIKEIFAFLRDYRGA